MKEIHSRGSLSCPRKIGAFSGPEPAFSRPNLLVFISGSFAYCSGQFRTPGCTRDYFETRTRIVVKITHSRVFLACPRKRTAFSGPGPAFSGYLDHFDRYLGGMWDICQISYISVYPCEWQSQPILVLSGNFLRGLHYYTICKFC